ncbi:MAG: KGG domain-containing protein [Deltaproteobacteria bacterium]
MDDREKTVNESPRTESAPEGTGKLRRGFAAMDTSRQRELASRGGRASHAKGTGHEWDRGAAQNAGKKGGIASGVSRNRKKQERIAAKKPG